MGLPAVVGFHAAPNGTFVGFDSETPPALTADSAGWVLCGARPTTTWQIPDHIATELCIDAGAAESDVGAAAGMAESEAYKYRV